MKKGKVVSILCASAIFSGGLLFSGCGGTSDISSISITTLPKTEYVVGNYIDLTGGKITALCDNGKQLELELGLANVDVGRLDTVGERVVNVTYANKKSSFKIYVKKANYDIKVPQIVVPYNGKPQGFSATSFSSEIALGEGMSIGEISYREKGEAAFTDNVPKNAGKYEIKVHIDGGEYYEDRDIITDYTIEKANFLGFKDQNQFQYAKTAFASYGLERDIRDFWLQKVDQNSSTIHNLDGVPGQVNPLGGITLLAEDVDEELIVEYKVFDSEKHQLTGVTNISDLDVGNYTIEVTCSTASQNFNTYTDKLDLSIKKKQLVLGEDFKVNVSYKNTSGETITSTLEAKDSAYDYSGDFRDVLENFEITINPTDNVKGITSQDFSYDLEYGILQDSNFVVTRDKIVPAVNQTGDYCLKIRLLTKNYEYVGMATFIVEMPNNGD